MKHLFFTVKQIVSGETLWREAPWLTYQNVHPAAQQEWEYSQSFMFHIAAVIDQHCLAAHHVPARDLFLGALGGASLV
jgi:hypothetical protein